MCGLPAIVSGRPAAHDGLVGPPPWMPERRHRHEDRADPSSGDAPKSSRSHRVRGLRVARGSVGQLRRARAARALPARAAPSTSSSVTPTKTSPTPSATPASWRSDRLLTVPWRLPPTAAVWDGKEMLIVLTQGRTHRSVRRDPGSRTTLRATPGAMCPSFPQPRGCFEGADRPSGPVHELLLWGSPNAAYDPATDTWRQLGRPPRTAGHRSSCGPGSRCSVGAADAATRSPPMDPRIPWPPTRGGSCPRRRSWDATQRVLGPGRR